MAWERAPDQVALADAWISAVVPGGPGLVAVGYVLEEPAPAAFASDAAVWVSPDGLSWQRVDDPALPTGPGDQEIADIVAGPLGLLAVGSDGLLTSPEGVAWSRVEDDDLNDVGIGSAASGGPGWVAVGEDSTTGDAAVLVSDDGMAWDRVASEALVGGPGPDALSIYDVVAGGPGLVAVGRVGSDDPHAVIWVSADGFEWERLPDETAGADRQLESVSADPASGKLVAFGWGAVWTSDDGRRWVPWADPENFEELPAPGSGAAWDGDRVVVGGYGLRPAEMWMSSDRGTTWDQVDTDTPAFDGNRLAVVDITRFGDRFVAVGGDEGVSLGMTIFGQPRIGVGGGAAAWVGEWTDQ